MKKLDLIIRITLGVILLFFGLNGIFHFFVPPVSSLDEERLFFEALVNTGYVFNTVTVVFLFAASTFLFNKLVPIGLLVLTPIIVNILLVHLRYSPQAIAPGAIIFILMLILFWLRKERFVDLFK